MTLGLMDFASQEHIMLLQDQLARVGAKKKRRVAKGKPFRIQRNGAKSTSKT